MSGASDKARFYLEQAVPQLQEFEQKKIFTKEEIRTLVKKRSDFEHKVLGRGSKPIDFAQYAAWEISLERLRATRCKRLRIKGSTTHAGQARIFSIFDRGTRKHFGDLSLWMSYLGYARTVKAIKKFKTVLTSALRLHCTKADLWLYAAKWSLEEDSDMNAARSYMQRGTRFCTKNKELWIEYAKLEMIYLDKINTRKRALSANQQTPILQINDGMNAAEDEFAASADVLAIPEVGRGVQPNTIAGVDVDMEAVKDLMATPALNGAIPLAIFDDARNQPFYNSAAAEDFFAMFAAFTNVSCQPRILQHVVDCMFRSFPGDPATCSCFVRQCIVGVDHMSIEFPQAIASMLERLKQETEETKDKKRFAGKMKSWLEPILTVPELDLGIQTVIKYTVRKLESL